MNGEAPLSVGGKIWDLLAGGILPHHDKQRGGYTSRLTLGGPIWTGPSAPGQYHKCGGPGSATAMVYRHRGYKGHGQAEFQYPLCLRVKKKPIMVTFWIPRISGTFMRRVKKRRKQEKILNLKG